MAKTKGGVIIENINIGDIHYEYGWGGKCIKTEVISMPERNFSKIGEDLFPQWKWQSKEIETGRIIDYLVTEGLEHYGPNLYDFEAYFIPKEDDRVI